MGFVRVDPPADGLTFAALRLAIAAQLDAFPDESYVFLLEGGVPVAPSQEATELTPEDSTDCFIAFFPSGRAAAAEATSTSPSAAALPSGECRRHECMAAPFARSAELR